MIRQGKRSGFTLIELLVVIAIIAILIGLLVPAVQKVREAAARALTLSNMGQIAKGTHTYAGDFKKLPPGQGTVGTQSGTVMFFLLPYVEQVNLFNQGQAVAKVTPVGLYVAPIDSTIITDGMTTTGLGASSYGFNINVFPAPAPANGGTKFPAAFNPAGTSNVVMLATVAANCTATAVHAHSDNTSTPILTDAQPIYQGPPYARQTAAALNGGSFQVAMGDASVRSVSQGVTLTTWKIVMNPKSTQPPGQDWME